MQNQLSYPISISTERVVEEPTADYHVDGGVARSDPYPYKELQNMNPLAIGAHLDEVELCCDRALAKHEVKGDHDAVNSPS